MKNNAEGDIWACSGIAQLQPMITEIGLVNVSRVLKKMMSVLSICFPPEDVFLEEDPLRKQVEAE